MKIKELNARKAQYGFCISWSFTGNSLQAGTEINPMMNFFAWMKDNLEPWTNDSPWFQKTTCNGYGMTMNLYTDSRDIYLALKEDWVEYLV